MLSVEDFMTWRTTSCGVTLTLLLGACGGDDEGSADDTAAVPTVTGVTTEAEPLRVDGVDYFPVAVSQQPDPNFFRLQINYGTADQLNQAVTETGANSTFAVTLSTTEAPTGSGVWDWTSNRFPADDTVVSGYLSFFFATGHPNEGLNFLSPDAGTLDVTLAGDRWTSPVTSATWTDEGGSAATVTVEGAIDAAFTLP